MSMISWHGKLGVTEASTLGWRPGHWPNSAQVDGVTLIRRIDRDPNAACHTSHKWYDVKGSDLQVMVMND